MPQDSGTKSRNQVYSMYSVAGDACILEFAGSKSDPAISDAMPPMPSPAGLGNDKFGLQGSGSGKEGDQLSMQSPLAAR